MYLVNIETGKEVKEGDTVKTFRGRPAILETIRPNEGRNGKVYVRVDGNKLCSRFYPDVIGCEFRTFQPPK